jgi:hypothetical protein
MMRERHHTGEAAKSLCTIKLGERDALIRHWRARKNTFPAESVSFNSDTTMKLLTHPPCPHLLGPLADSDLSQGLLTYPWHHFWYYSQRRLRCDRLATCSLPPNAIVD